MSIDVTSIVVAAQTLKERLDNIGAEEQCLCLPKTHNRSERWRHVTSGSKGEWFQRRLNWDSIDTKQFNHVLESSPSAEIDCLPSWAQILSRVIDQSLKISKSNHVSDNSFSPLEKNHPVPFEELLMPFILVGREILFEKLGHSKFNIPFLSQEAYLTFEKSLLWRLNHVMGRTLIHELSSIRTFGENFFSALAKEDSKSKKQDAYINFVNHHLEDGLDSIFQNYPVLAKLSSMQVEFWIESTFRFISRLERDLPEISHIFGSRIDDSDSLEFIAKVTGVRPDLSDPHHCGQSVIACAFESGHKLVYKPKNLDLQHSYNNLLDWINIHGTLPNLKTPKVLCRDEYGWVEYIENLPCQDLLGVERFYTRSGMILCLLSILGGTDCHNENLLAHGEHFVLIDIETVMCHHAKSMSLDANQPLVHTLEDSEATLLSSLRKTGLLPEWESTSDRGSVFDGSGMGGDEEDTLQRTYKVWININTDQMSLTTQTSPLPRQSNLPYIDQKIFHSWNYLEHIVSGFQAMYRFLLENRHRLLHDTSLISDFREKRTRFIFRPTQIYSDVLEKSLDSKFMKNGLDRSIELEILSRSFLWTSTKTEAWPIFHAEVDALEQLDIPYFYTQSQSNNIFYKHDQIIEDYFDRSGYEQLTINLENLNQHNMQKQVDIIKGMFFARNAIASVIESPLLAHSLSDEHKLQFNRSIPSSEALLSSAEQISIKIIDSAISGANGLSWRGLCYISSVERFKFSYIGQNLYDGVCGTSLFLAALYSINKNIALKDTVLRALQPIRTQFHRILEKSNDLQTYKPRLGAAIGIGSIIYSFSKIGKYLDDSSLYEDINLFLERMTPEMIDADQTFDILNGTSGLILSLLSLLDRKKDFSESDILAKVVCCGNHLLQHRVSTDCGYKTWKTIADVPLTGFSHGSAGIAYALVKLYQTINDQRYLDAALEAIAYENSHYSANTNNWPDFRKQTADDNSLSFGLSWCHGAPGIGLARLGCLPILEQSQVIEDIENALEKTVQVGLQENDSLCCGNFSRIEFLQMASEKLDRPDLRTMALQQALYLISKAEQGGGFKLFSNVPRDVLSPNFFQGSAGIGYELLRLAYPHKFPSTLLWS